MKKLFKKITCAVVAFAMILNVGAVSGITALAEDSAGVTVNGCPENCGCTKQLTVSSIDDLGTPTSFTFDKDGDGVEETYYAYNDFTSSTGGTCWHEATKFVEELNTAFPQADGGPFMLLSDKEMAYQWWLSTGDGSGTNETTGITPGTGYFGDVDVEWLAASDGDYGFSWCSSYALTCVNDGKDADTITSDSWDAIAKLHCSSYMGFVVVRGPVSSATFDTTVTNTSTGAEVTMSGLSDTYNYTGSAITPKVEVSDQGKTLTEGTDYTVSYENNISIGTGVITITGMGNYTGTLSKTFKIYDYAANKLHSIHEGGDSYYNTNFLPAYDVWQIYADIPLSSVLGDNCKFVYTTDGGKTFQDLDDYTCKDSSNITVEGSSAEQSMRILALCIQNIGAENVYVQGTPDKPFYGLAFVDADVAFGTSHSNTTVHDLWTDANDGLKPQLAAAGISTMSAYETNAAEDYYCEYFSESSYTNMSSTPVPTLNGISYSLFWTSYKDYGLYADTSSLWSSYFDKSQKPTSWDATNNQWKNSCDYTKHYAVVLVEDFKNDISSAEISNINSDTAYEYTGSAVEPTPTVVIDGVTLAEGFDYTVSYENNSGVGTGTITITGTGDFKGTLTKEFKIQAPATASAFSTGTIIVIAVVVAVLIGLCIFFIVRKKKTQKQ